MLPSFVLPGNELAAVAATAGVVSTEADVELAVVTTSDELFVATAVDLGADDAEVVVALARAAASPASRTLRMKPEQGGIYNH